MNTPDVQEILRGLAYSHNPANANAAELHKTAQDQGSIQERTGSGPEV